MTDCCGSKKRTECCGGTAKDTDLNVIIDGCPMDCARKIFDNISVTRGRQIMVPPIRLLAWSSSSVRLSQSHRMVIA